MWLYFLPAIVAVGVGGYFLLTRSGVHIIAYANNIADGRHLAYDLSPADWTKFSFSSVDDLLTQLSRHRRIASVTIIAHGGSDWFYNRALTAQLLGYTLASRLVSGGIVSLAGCSAARGPGEVDAWVPEAFGPGGARSYTGALRDQIRAYHGPWFGEVRGHTLTGHTTGNPSVRYFPLSEVGQPGHGIMPAGYTVGQWVAEFGELPAHRWITAQA